MTQPLFASYRFNVAIVDGREIFQVYKRRGKRPFVSTLSQRAATVIAMNDLISTKPRNR